MDMKFETILNALEQSIYEIQFYARAYQKTKLENYRVKSERRPRQARVFRARLLSLYSLDTLRRLEQSRDYWQRRAYLADQENLDLRERLEDLENAWAVDETIQPDGSLRPSLADTTRRAAELEAENRQLCELRVQELREELEQTKRFTDALRPFAKLAEQADTTIYRWQDDQQIGTFSPFGADWPTLGDCRRAREALLPKKDGDA
jgi:hypothetical protein